MQECCPLCKSSSTITFLQRERVPVHQHLILRDQQAALETMRGDLILKVCAACGFVFNQALEIGKLAYGERRYLAHLIDPERECFVCVVDLNPSKQSSYIIGTGHPIVSIDDLHSYGVSYTILLNPNYFDEVREMLAVKALPIALVNLGG